MLRCADLEMDDDAHRVRRAGHEVSLSPTEYNLLRYLLVNQGRVVSKAQILDHVWQYDFGGDGGVVETYIGYLRRKIDNVDPRLIHTDPRASATRCAEQQLDVAPRPPARGMAVVAFVLVAVAVRHRPHHRGQPRRPGRRSSSMSAVRQPCSPETRDGDRVRHRQLVDRARPSVYVGQVQHGESSSLVRPNVDQRRQHAARAERLAGR